LASKAPALPRTGAGPGASDAHSQQESGTQFQAPLVHTASDEQGEYSHDAEPVHGSPWSGGSSGHPAGTLEHTHPSSGPPVKPQAQALVLYTQVPAGPPSLEAAHSFAVDASSEGQPAGSAPVQAGSGDVVTTHVEPEQTTWVRQKNRGSLPYQHECGLVVVEHEPLGTVAGQL
jgi:hypothetical protein